MSMMDSFNETLQSELANKGQGEPVAWRITTPGGVVYSTKYPAWSVFEGATIEPLHAEQPAQVAVVMSFDFEHPCSKEKRTVALSKQDVFDGMEDYFYDKLGEQICQCESVGETNVVDCNCDEYVHDFEIVQACLDEVGRLNSEAKP